MSFGNDGLSRVHPGGRQAAGGHRRGHQPAAEELTRGGDDVEQQRIGGAALADGLERRAKVVEMPVDGGQERAVRIGAQPGRFVHVPAAEGGDAVLDLAARVPGPGGLGERQQPVRDAPQGGHDHHRRAAPAALPFHN